MRFFTARRGLPIIRACYLWVVPDQHLRRSFCQDIQTPFAIHIQTMRAVVLCAQIQCVQNRSRGNIKRDNTMSALIRAAGIHDAVNSDVGDGFVPVQHKFMWKIRQGDGFQPIPALDVIIGQTVGRLFDKQKRFAHDIHSYNCLMCGVGMAYHFARVPALPAADLPPLSSSKLWCG